MLARYLFAHTTAHRIWAGTEVNNIAEQKALDKAGFTREGIMRGTRWRDGAWRDDVIYSLLRTDPPVSVSLSCPVMARCSQAPNPVSGPLAIPGRQQAAQQSQLSPDTTNQPREWTQPSSCRDLVYPYYRATSALARDLSITLIAS